MDNNNQKPKRRIRYKGTYPKTYQEKYKELQPEKYSETIEKVIAKGSTPAGMHISICVSEILDFLQIRPGQRGLDATLGYGGHTLEILKRLDFKGHLYAIDVDPIESAKTKERLAKLGYGEDILSIKNMNFKDVDLLSKKVGMFDFIVADLGISSMQVDNPERGFSYKKEGPLDLRLNPNQGITAEERLKYIKLDELEGMLIENANEPYAEVIAKAIISEIKRKNEISTTTRLKEIIADALSFLPGDNQKEAIKKSCQRVFQALRIDLNKEFEVLYNFLEKIPQILNKGGRVAILTFHSGEDRLVKKSFQYFYKQGLYSQIAIEVIRPTDEECNKNNRARSAKMRWAIAA